MTRDEKHDAQGCLTAVLLCIIFWLVVIYTAAAWLHGG
jgi:hypothetical protein